MAKPGEIVVLITARAAPDLGRVNLVESITLEMPIRAPPNQGVISESSNQAAGCLPTTRPIHTDRGRLIVNLSAIRWI